MDMLRKSSMVIINGKILTIDKLNPSAEAVAEAILLKHLCREILSASLLKKVMQWLKVRNYWFMKP